MNDASGEFLAGPGSASDHHARVGGSNALDYLSQLVHHRRLADDPVRRASACAQVRNFATESGRFQRAIRHKHQSVGLERLLNEVVCAELDRGHRRLDVAVTGNHHDGKRRMVLLDHLQELQTVEPRPLHPDVQKTRDAADGLRWRQAPHLNSSPCASRVLRRTGCPRRLREYRSRRQRSEYRQPYL